MEKKYMAYDSTSGQIVSYPEAKEKVETKARNYTQKTGNSVLLFEAVSYTKAPVAPIDIVPISG